MQEQDSHDIIFTHPYVHGRSNGQATAEGSPLVVHTGADSIKWSYSLNTANFPTYGGEVVQILSVAIDDVSIQGTLHSYAEMEDIYSYFIEFIQIASQGRGNDPVAGKTAYNQQPMLMQYPHRNWSMKVIPRNLPGFRKGRDVVAPEWQMTAYVVDDSEDIDELKDLVLEGVSIQGEDFELSGKIGYVPNNPFSDPFPENKGKIDFDRDKTKTAWSEYGDYFNKIIPSWLDGDFDSITDQFGSSPAFLKYGSKQGADGTTYSQQRGDGKNNKGKANNNG